MTNEEARQWFLKVYSEIKGKGYADENEEAYELAIKALEQEPCDDVVSRQAVLNVLVDADNWAEEFDSIKALPPVRPQEPKTGHWIEMPIGFKCSNCNELEYRTTKYCPNCKCSMQNVMVVIKEM